MPIDSRLKHNSNTDEENTIAGASTAYPYPHDSINSQGQQENSRGFRSTKESPMHMRSTQQARKNNPVNRIIDNLNKKKFTTNIDEEADKIRLRNEEVSKRKNLTSVEPFWQDFNSTITDICKQKEDPAQKMGRTRGPSQPQMRNKSSNKMQMNSTMNSFKMG